MDTPSIASARSIALDGLDGAVVQVEAVTGPGLPRTVLVGFPDPAVCEARNRVRAAFASAGLAFPAGTLTVSLLSLSLPKAGSQHDLALAATVLAVAGHAPVADPGTVFLGELALDGSVRRVRGLFAMVGNALANGFTRVVVPACQVDEALLVDDVVKAVGVNDLADLVAVLSGRRPKPPRPRAAEPRVEPSAPGLAGYPGLRRACEVAAAGGHHLLVTGATPSGWVAASQAAAYVAAIMPDLGRNEAIEVSAVRSLAGEDLSAELVRRPPLVSVHRTAAVAAVVGGGSRLARPGAVALAHLGVLSLPDLPEFSPRVLESLRAPMDTGVAVVVRAGGLHRFPARFALVATASPCPCGLLDGSCRCAPAAVRRYAAAVPDQIVDRIGIRCTVGRPVPDDAPEPVEAVKDRLSETSVPWRHETSVPHSVPFGRMSENLRELVRAQAARGRLSIRGADLVARLAWTVAGLADRPEPTFDDLAEAMRLHGDPQEVSKRLGEQRP